MFLNLNLYKMQQNREATDCCFAFEIPSKDLTKETETRFVYAHKMVLFAVSPVFKTMFSDKWSKDDKIVIKDTSFDTFDALIKAIYTGCFDAVNIKEMLKILCLAHLYQIDYITKEGTTYVIKLYNETQNATFELLNHACLYNNLRLKEVCLTDIKIYTYHYLTEDSFLVASTDAVNLIFSLDELNIESETVLVEALEKYLQKHPETRSELEEAINNIRFLTMEEDDIMKCSFLENKLREQLVILKNQSQLPSYDLLNFSKQRTNRKGSTLISFLPASFILRLYEIFDDKFCFMCKKKHSSIMCENVQTYYKTISDLKPIYSKYSHTSLERYNNDDIKRIIKLLRKDKATRKLFDDYLDLPLYLGI